MRQNLSLTITSLLSIILMTLHVADDIVRGFDRVGSIFFAVAIAVVWLYGTLVLAGRRPGYVIILIGSLLAMLVPVIHLRATGAVATGEISRSSGAFFFVWALIALGVTASFSVVLSARELWRLGRSAAR